MSSADVTRGVNYLLKGGKMLDKPCPSCHSLLFLIKDSIVCSSCSKSFSEDFENKHAENEPEELETNPLPPNHQKSQSVVGFPSNREKKEIYATLSRKIEVLLQKIEDEDDPLILSQLCNALHAVINVGVCLK